MDETPTTVSPVAVTDSDLIPKRFQWLCAPAVFGVLTLAMFFDVLFTSTVVISNISNDTAMQFLAWRDFGFGQLRQGNLPLWNPHVYGGAPFFAGFQSALLYPPNWLHLILPLATAINWIVAIHVFLLGYFTYLWCRGRAIGISGSILAGVMYMFCGPYFLHLYAGHLPHLAIIVWTPLLFLTIDKIAATGSVRWYSLGIISVTMELLAGHPQYVYYTGMILTVYTGLLMIRSQHRKKLALGFVVMYAGAVLIAAVQLFAGFQAAGESVRSGGLAYETASTFALPPENFITLIAPTFFSNLPMNTPTPDDLPYWGAGYLWEMSLFVSITGLALSFLGMIRGPRRTVALIIGMLVLTFTLALGRHTWLYWPMFKWWPQYSSFRGTVKFAYLSMLFVSLLAAMGLDDLIRRPKTNGFVAFCAASTFAVLLVGISISASSGSGIDGWWGQFVHSVIESAAQGGEAFYDERMSSIYTAWHSMEPSATSPQMVAARAQLDRFVVATANHASSMMYLAAATLLAITLLLWAARFHRYFPYGLVLLASIEMFCFARSTRATMDPAVASQVPAPWKDEIARLPKDNRIWIWDLTYFSRGMTMGFDNLTGNDPMILKRYAELAYASQGQSPLEPSQYVFEQNPVMNGPVMRMLRCTLFCFVPSQPAQVIPIQAMPVASLISNWTVYQAKLDLLKTVVTGGFDLATTVLLEDRPAFQMVPSNEPAGTVRVVNQSTDWLELEADVQRTAVLLITNNYSTGWRVRPIESPQTEFQVLPANYFQIGIPLTAGKHHILLEYSPLAFRIGRWVSILALLSFLGWTILLMRRQSWFR